MRERLSPRELAEVRQIFSIFDLGQTHFEAQVAPLRQHSLVHNPDLRMSCIRRDLGHQAKHLVTRPFHVLAETQSVENQQTGDAAFHVPRARCGNDLSDDDG